FAIRLLVDNEHDTVFLRCDPQVGADTWLRQSDKQGRDQEARPCGHDNSFIDSHRQICLSPAFLFISKVIRAMDKVERDGGGSARILPSSMVAGSPPDQPGGVRWERRAQRGTTTHPHLG